MSSSAALSKLGRTLALGRTPRTRAALLALFGARYNYPGCGLLRLALRRFVAAETITLALRINGPIDVVLRPADIGDVASLFENLVESDHAAQVPAAPRRAVDAGAHIGFFSLWLHDRFPSTHITAFEPNPKNVDLLRRNFEMNRVEGDVRAAAVWSETTRLRFADEQSNAGHVLADGEDTVRSVSVAAESIIDVMGDAIEEVDLVKLDIEGAEMQVMPGLLARLGRSCRVILELHDVVHTAREFHQMVKKAGWKADCTAQHGPHEMWVLNASVAG